MCFSKHGDFSQETWENSKKLLFLGIRTGTEGQYEKDVLLLVYFYYFIPFANVSYSSVRNLEYLCFTLDKFTTPFGFCFFFFFFALIFWLDRISVFFKNIYLVVLGLSWGMWYLVPWPGIESGPPALGAQSFSHWTTREVLDRIS